MNCHAAETADAATEMSVIMNTLKDESSINLQQESDTSLSFKGPGFQTFAIRIRPFWITTDPSNKKQFYFRSSPPSMLDRFKHRGPVMRGGSRSAESHERLTGEDIANSLVLPVGSFYRFE